MAKPDVYQMVTDKILTALDAGVVPWHKPWDTSQAMNALTGRAYKGINVWLLGLTEYTDPRWITYKNATALGGNPRKGEKSTFIVFWNMASKTDDDGNEKRFFFLKYFNVFNVEQCENLDEEKLYTLPEKKENHTQELAEAIINGMPNPPSFKHSGDRAFYTPSLDAITMPHIADFDSANDYHAAKFHEFSHSTGHESRPNRSNIGFSDYSIYSF